MLKNIEKATVLKLNDLLAYQDGQVISKTFSQNPAVGLTMFCLPKGEEISAYKSRGDALVTILEGKARITIDTTDYEVNAGESIVLPADIPHALYALENFKMFLTVVFPKEGR
ncbi:cupin [Aggregatibacter actinomycetemcomitans]|uniref:cupin domain-containing protein n=1 Tax=Aggregatibacter actinomycetemcomitans TaxID=714 RepID=UPI000BA19FA9|nr:cupin domain-containing protein [Aggregatibacter actinomycetemcomitans]OZV16920.1 cupin [Aggregatibacter actinomycetemcomitans]